MCDSFPFQFGRRGAATVRLAANSLYGRGHGIPAPTHRGYPQRLKSSLTTPTLPYPHTALSRNAPRNDWRAAISYTEHNQEVAQ
jgi:hypothetical protein